LYNKNGRIGIYTPAERATIIARFNEKRSRRNWNKKIRYNCRKNLADRRLRVKGRFVKRSDQEELAKLIDDERISIETDNQKRVSISEVVEIHTPVLDSEEGDEDDSSNDEDMPDTSDPDADFVPTEDQPYRRLRRHTIT
jgi:CCT motif